MKGIEKLAILQEHINELINTIIKNKYNGKEMLKFLKSNKYFNEDVIDAFYMQYYIMNINNKNNNIKELVKFIGDYSLNKNLLREFFLGNDGIAIEITNNYVRSFTENSNINKYYDKTSSKDKKNIQNLSSLINYRSLDYISELARTMLIKLASENIESLNQIQVITEKMELNDSSALKSFLISDAYLYMNLYNNDHQYDLDIKIIEEYSDNFNDLWNLCILSRNKIYNYLYYLTNLFLEIDYYDDYYKMAALTNSKFLKTLKKINPYCLLDEIESFQMKKYRK